eukprot:c16505_g1_i1.p1 GENE.c16505_g1_i1~~c16505_g1_i1.p1  ORF type:complete len:528 (+),score=114.87 c16505_g1_i1:51-1634(+)
MNTRGFPREFLFSGRNSGVGGMSYGVRMIELMDQVKSEYERVILETTSLKQLNEDYERKLEEQITELERVQRIIQQLLAGTKHPLDPEVQEPLAKRQRLDAPPAAVPEALPPFQPVQSRPSNGGALPSLPKVDMLQTAPLSLDKPLAPLNIPANVALPPLSSSPSPPPAQPVSGPKIKEEPKETPAAPASLGTPGTEEEQDWVVSPHTDGIRLQHSLPHESVVCCVRFSDNGKFLATGSNKVAQVFEVKSGRVVGGFNTEASRGRDEEAQAPTSESYVRSVCFSPDSTRLAAGAEDKTIRIWDIASQKLVQVLNGHEGEIYSLDYSKDGKLLASGSGDKTAKIWDVEKQSCVHVLGDRGEVHGDGVTSVSFSPDNKHLVTGSLDRNIRMWDVATGACARVLKGHDEPVYSVMFSPNGKFVASGSLDKSLRLWDPATGTCIATFRSHSDYVLSVAFTKDSDWLVSGSKDRTVAFWDPNSQSSEPFVALQGHKNSVISVAMSPGGTDFATGSGDSQARLWSYANLRSDS